MRWGSTWLAARDGRWTRSDWAVVGLATLAVLARWGERARYLMSWDSHTFAIALTDYDVNGLHPHAPGYPVYVALGRLVFALLPDANDAYILLSLLFTAASLALAYDLGRRLAGRAVALAAVVLLLASPLVFAHSVTANVYSADLLGSTAVAWLAWRTRHIPTSRNILALAAVFSLAVGVRPSLVFFLGPLVAWAALRPPWVLREQVRRLWKPVAAGIAIGLAWFLPMVQGSGGYARWKRANDLQSEVVFEHTAWQDGWTYVALNLDRLGLYLRWELGWVLPALVLLLAALVVLRLRGPSRPAPPAPKEGAIFLVLWAVPALLFYLTVYSGYANGPSGYTLILLPASFLAAALMAKQAAGRLATPAVGAVLCVAALGIASAGLLVNTGEVEDVRYEEHDAWMESWLGLPAAFPSSNSTLVTAYNFAPLWYYFPSYDVFEYRPAGKAVGEVPDFLMIQHAKNGTAKPDWYDEIADHKTFGPNPLPNGTRHLVLFDFQLAGENGGTRAVKADIPVREAFLPSGWRVLVVDTTPDRPLLEDYFTMEGAA